MMVKTKVVMLAGGVALLRKKNLQTTLKRTFVKFEDFNLHIG